MYEHDDDDDDDFRSVGCGGSCTRAVAICGVYFRMLPHTVHWWGAKVLIVL